MPNPLPSSLTYRNDRWARFSAVTFGCLSIAALAAATGCQARIGQEDSSGPGAGAGATAGTGATSAGGSSGVGGSGFGGTAGVAEGCTNDPGGLLAPKRVLRLTLDQTNNSIRDFIDSTIADEIGEEYQLHDEVLREFPAHLGEGHLFTELLWSKVDGMAQLAAEYVRDNFTAVTACAAADEACAIAYATSFAEKTARRPLNAEEQARVQQLITEVQGYGGTPEQVAQYGVYAALSSPQFLYRSELGTDAALEEILTPYELASMLSYFITGGPPDDQLLADAAAQTLSSPDALRAQATRLLETEEAHQYLQTLILASFGIPRVYSVVITAPEFNQGVANSMVESTRRFINGILWSGVPVNELLTSNTGWVNDQLAPFYGVAAPAGTEFGQVELPPERAGLLTDLGYLTSSARPDFPSVVGRGVKVVDELLCVERGEFPNNLGAAIEAFNEEQAGKTEREKAQARFEQVPCSGCHLQTDPYGLALFSYDEIGRFRTTDPEGRPIDSSVTLPEFLESAVVSGSAEMASVMAESGAFMGCVAGNLMEDAIGEGTVFATDCAARAVLNELAARGSSTFPDLVREVSASRTMAIRRGGI